MRSENAISYRLSAIGQRIKRLIADSRWPIALFGMPDYQRYLDHRARCHPGEAVLSEKEFVDGELKRKYEGGGARCC